jgi:hypothetical protein
MNITSKISDRINRIQKLCPPLTDWISDRNTAMQVQKSLWTYYHGGSILLSISNQHQDRKGEIRPYNPSGHPGWNEIKPGISIQVGSGIIKESGEKTILM